MELKHFKLSEFDSPDARGSGGNMRASTLVKLDEARRLYGKPLRVTSGFRTKEYAQVLRERGYQVAKNSAHLTGYAADIMPLDALESDLTKWAELLDALWNAGFRRFGIMGQAIHIDDDPTKSSPALWNYNTTRYPVWAMVQNWYAKKSGGRNG
jgi:hypothetical protein